MADDRQRYRPMYKTLIVRGVTRVEHAVHHSQLLLVIITYYSIAAAAAGGDVISREARRLLRQSGG